VSDPNVSDLNMSDPSMSDLNMSDPSTSAQNLSASHCGLDNCEATILQVLRDNPGRVVTRTQLAQAAGLRKTPRRVDFHLVNVRRHLGEGRLQNVRSRGWMISE
jgi:DNA-binding response OmpR family regulator